MHADLHALAATHRLLVRTTTLLFTLLAAPAFAQPSSLNRILFEAQPLPWNETGAPVAVASTPVTVMRGLGPLLGGENRRADVESYLRSIADIELDGGPFAPNLMEQYLALGETHQQQQDHEAALEAFEKAEYISRINNGLYSPEQFAIVENMIESHLARGELDKASERQRYLLLLHEQQYGVDGFELVPALNDFGDWNFTVFERRLRMSNAVFSFSSGQGPGGRAMSPRAMAFMSLYQSQMSYWRAINIMLANAQYGDPRLHELEHKLIETSFLSSNREGLMNNPDFYLSKRTAHTGTRIRRSERPNSPYFFTGRSAYERLIAYELLQSGGDAVAVGQLLIALADWHLVFDRQGSAIRAYERAHEFLVVNAVPQATIDTLLSPAMPQQLPAFTPLPHSREKFGIAADADVRWDGYIDLRFTINRFGQAEHFDVIASEGPVTKDLQSRLRRMLRSTPFRPRFGDGKPLRGDTVEMRYYFAQMQ
jgi:tetratricopeptide (TPR) repeat protein